MNNRDLLLEIGCEEIPARFVADASRQLGEKLVSWLREERISYESYRTYSTPRRLAVLVTGVAERQEDIREEVRGPAARIARTPEGTWSKAAEGFARKQGVSVEQLALKEFKGETYVFAEVHQAGKKTAERLIDGIPAVVGSLHFPKTMRWGTRKERFIRPVRWLVCLFGEETVPVKWAGVEAGSETRGHRFLGNVTRLESAAEYAEVLRRESVLVDPEERRERILSQLRQLEEERGWVIPVDQDLLHEVVNLVEFPTALAGGFDEAFLDVPREVLITTMREHQRYFPVEDKEGKLLPHFVTVKNGGPEGLELVARGNEKVLRARLADARFFFEEDLKLQIGEAVDRLENIVHQEELGTVGDRVRRIGELARFIGQELGFSAEEAGKLLRAAAICKFDLATQMVGEFPELEGTMGRIYALAANEDPQVAEAVYEHHLPRAAGDELPKSRIGTVLALADKVEAVTSSFSIGIQPTGSQDPYGLRRRASAVVQILLQKEYGDLSLRKLIARALDLLEKAGLIKVDRREAERDLLQFFSLRLKTVLQDKDIRYDVIDAALGAGIEHPGAVVERAAVLMDQLDREAFKNEVEGFTRVANLAVKAGDSELYLPGLVAPAELALVRAWKEAVDKFESAERQGDFPAMYQALAHMVPDIHRFFDEIMVMVDDEQVRNNRLALLREITRLTRRFAAFEQIVFA
ncbi:glycine--tRNA ligase subunit beta [Staphylospora marina]|uniref:glycine--tRNA ligase subunit beta n=1 Tax=Staphylospora marina TaxID=2490858 RepID=UPI000F5BF5F4|nr:glycine--tRNA ligase subunit beta [Staphylospora marina]